MGNITSPERIAAGDYIKVHVAASKKYLDLSPRMVQLMCQRGVFKSAFKGGMQTSRSKWKILRSEVIAHKIRGHFHPDNY